MKTKYIEIEPRKLIIDKFNARGDEWNPYDDDENKLIESIKAQGVLEPLLLRPTKGQKSKYPKGKELSIICGNRRWRASLEARTKTIPAVIRYDLDDIGALGTSIQENLKRRSMDKIPTANAVGKLWDMLNGTRTYEKKMAEMKKQFGMTSTPIQNYLNLYKLTKEIHLPADVKKVDTDTLANIQTSDWSKKEKEQAIKIASKIESANERRLAISEMKKKSDEFSVTEAYTKYVKEVEDTKGESFDIYLNAMERKATRNAAKKLRLEINTLIKKNHRDWLRKNKWLN